MKSLLFFVITFIPFLSYSQFKVTEREFQDVLNLVDQGKTEDALKKINSIRLTGIPQDTLYQKLIAISAELNTNAFNLEAAIKDYEDLIKTHIAPEKDIRIQLGRLKKMTGDYNGSVKEYQRALQLDAADTIAYANLASAYNAAAKYQEALKTLTANRSIKKLPLEHSNFAIAYYRLNKVKEAKQHIDLYLADESSQYDFVAYKLAAQIYQGLGDPKQACIYILRANTILSSLHVEEQLSKQPERVRNYAIFREASKETEETKKLKETLCK